MTSSWRKMRLFITFDDILIIKFSVNFTDPDYRASPKIDVRQNSRSSAWNGIELVLIESGGTLNSILQISKTYF